MEWLLEHIWFLPVFLIGIFLGLCLLCGIYYLFEEWRINRSFNKDTKKYFDDLLKEEQMNNSSEYSSKENNNKNISKIVSMVQSSTGYGLNEMNVIDEFIKIEDVIFTYIHHYKNNQSDTSIYNFKLDTEGNIENQYLLFYTSSGLKKEIMIGHYNEDMIAVDADEMKILSVQEFKKMFLESIDFLKNNKFYSSEIKKKFNLVRFEKICEKGE